MDREPTVLVVGGGATGAGVVRDLAMRGVDVALVERGGLTGGATGHTHGLLHSGARYAVDDPESARSCIAESRVLRDVAPHCVDETGGYFLQLSGDSPEYFERKLDACRDCDVPATVVPADELRDDQPGVTTALERAIRVPDAVVDPFALTVANAVDAADRGATVETHAEVTDLLTDDDAVVGAELRYGASTDTETVEVDHVVNATGAWAGELAAMAGVEVAMRPSSGAMVTLECPELETVLNRCRPTADGDIVLPRAGTAVAGTTSRRAETPDDHPTEAAEVETVIGEAAAMLPDLADAPVVRTYWGVRPLYEPTGRERDDRAVTRGFALLDHAERDGLAGFTTVVGGKLTTYRRMAEAVADHVCDALDAGGTCRTDEEPLPGPGDESYERGLALFGPRPPGAE